MLQHSPDFICMDKHTRSKLLQAVTKDVQFLQSQGLMDYSLLLGIETLDNDSYEEEPHSDDKHCFAAPMGVGINYHFAIIDYLQ